MTNYQAIYQICIDGKWMDYVRLPVQRPDDAIANIHLLIKDRGKPFRARVEDWRDRNAEPDVYYGDWDRSMLSPAAQSCVIKPLT